MNLAKPLLFFLLVCLALCEEAKIGDEVSVFVNKIRPFRNPSETYKYYKLPYCRPEHIQEKDESFTQLLSGNRKLTTLYKILMGKNMEEVEICQGKLTQRNIENFKQSIRNEYIYEMFVDDLPVVDAVGIILDDYRYFLKTHIHFQVSVDPKLRIVDVTIVSKPEHYTDITRDEARDDVRFTYSVEFLHNEEIPYSERYRNYQKKNGMIEKTPGAHYFSLINSFSLFGVLLCFFLYLVLGSKDQDYLDAGTAVVGEKPEKIESDARTASWRTIRNDIFVTPESKNILSAFVGTGVQLFLIITLGSIMGFCGLLYGDEGFRYPNLIILYAFTTSISGYTSSRLYRHIGGEHWGLNIITTAVSFPAPVFFSWFLVNNIGRILGITIALKISTVLFIIAVYFLLSLPLVIFGGITGRIKSRDTILESNQKGLKIQKVIPSVSILDSPLFSAFLLGASIFMASYTEIYSIVHSVWSQSVYNYYGSLSIGFVLLVTSSGLGSMIMTYFQFNHQNYKWWWNSFVYSGITGAYFFWYTVYYYFYQSEMDGKFQFLFYFLMNLLISYGLFLILGSVGFLSSFWLAKKLYNSEKQD